MRMIDSASIPGCGVVGASAPSVLLAPNIRRKLTAVILLSLFAEVSAWTAQSGVSIVTVDEATFAYQVQVSNQTWLSDGGVAVQCGGRRFSSGGSSGGTPLVGGAISVRSDRDPIFGAFDVIARQWHAAGCGAILTEIRHFAATDSPGIQFVTTALGNVNNTATCFPPQKRFECKTTATEFPSFQLPAATAEIGFQTWGGITLESSFSQNVSPNSTLGFGGFTAGGIQGGPLIMYAWQADPSKITAVVLGPSSEFKTAVLSQVEGRLVAGAHGITESLPANFSVGFSLTAAGGLTSSMMAYGASIQKAHGTADTKLSLADDVLNRQLHYLTDAGSLLNYCDYWPGCVNSTSGCTPIADSLTDVAAYHKIIGLEVGLYHVDPFWFSHLPHGGCNNGPLATNFSASPFHFPQGAAAVGLPMMLFLQAFEPSNVYAGQYAFSGKSVAATDSSRFFDDRLSELVRTSRLSALTLDGLQDVWYSNLTRLSVVGEQDLYDKGLADAAFKLKLPIRVDQELPGDILSSVQYGVDPTLGASSGLTVVAPLLLAGSRTTGRCTGDAVPKCAVEAVRFMQLASNSLFLRSVGMRPMVDALWTTPHQTDPVWLKPCKTKVSVIHDVITAVLSTGPVGFGDLNGKTDSALLARAVRKDGVILKPASCALRADRYYGPLGGVELWVAPSGPAGSRDARSDGRANSMVPFETLQEGHSVWWWNILVTNAPSREQPLALKELWPRPAIGSKLIVAKVATTDDLSPAASCVNGSAVEDCLTVWDADTPLPVGTSGGAHWPGAPAHNFSLFAAAPVLSSGWALLGELGKFVPCSPQRFVVPTVHHASVGLREADMWDENTGLRFVVIGVAAEKVQVSVVAPTEGSNYSVTAGIVVLVDVVVGESGHTVISCRFGHCTTNSDL